MLNPILPLDNMDPVLLKREFGQDLCFHKVLAYLEAQPGAHMTVSAFLSKLGASMPGIGKVCTHPGEEQRHRLQGLRMGLSRFTETRKDQTCPR